MNQNFIEYYAGQTGLMVEVDKCLLAEESPYQKIEVYETPYWGKLMVLDGMVMLSEKDEFVYHEMLTHVSLFSHPEPKRVLIIGGGDGGTAREVLRHASVDKVDLVEIDHRVIQAAKKYFPEVGRWDDPRLQVHEQDGVKFVENITELYDVILVDGSDAVGPAEGLFTSSFWETCRKGLTPQGVLATQAGGPWVEKYHAELKSLYDTLDDLFTVEKIYTAPVPLYPAGLWSFVVASRGQNPLDDNVLMRVEQGLVGFGSSLKYYNREIHESCFTMPNFVRNIISS